MAKKEGSTKQGKAITAGKVRALKALNETHSRLYALATLGEEAEKVLPDESVLHYAVEGIVQSIWSSCDEAREALPNGHKAIEPIFDCEHYLHSLTLFVKLLDANTDMPRDSQSSEFRRMVSRIVLCLTVQAGRYAERAEQALDVSSSMGFLKGEFMDSDMEQVSDATELTVLRLLRMSNDKDRAMILAFAQATRDANK